MAFSRIFFSAIILFSILAANTCSKKTEKMQSLVHPVVIDKSFDFSANAASYVIKEAVLKDSLLTLTIEAALCEEDVVELVFNGNYLKSMPPKAQLGIRFTENSKCVKNKIVRVFNVSSIKYQRTKTTILLLPNQEPITY